MLHTHSIPRLTSLFLLLLTTLAGCSTAEKMGIARTGTPNYSEVFLVYNRYAAQGLLSNDKDPLENASQSSDSAPQPVASRLRLTVQYPVPDTSDGLARAVLERIPNLTTDSEEPSAPKSFAGYVFNGVKKIIPYGSDVTEGKPVEVGVYDFPKQELDLLLSELNNSGYFSDQDRSGTRTSLNVKIDRGRRTNKVWTPEPRLDHFIKQIEYDHRRLENMAAAPGRKSL